MLERRNPDHVLSQRCHLNRAAFQARLPEKYFFSLLVKMGEGYLRFICLGVIFSLFFFHMFLGSV